MNLLSKLTMKIYNAILHLLKSTKQLDWAKYRDTAQAVGQLDILSLSLSLSLLLIIIFTNPVNTDTKGTS